MKARASLADSWAGRGISGGTLGSGKPGRARRACAGPPLSLAPPAGAARSRCLHRRARGPASPNWPNFSGKTSGFRKACEKQTAASPLRAWPARRWHQRRGRRPPGRCRRSRSPAELARFLDLEPNELDWFADCQTREGTATSSALRHYRYRWVAKRSGSLRLIEAPKPRLKQLQRRLLDEILLHIPPHEAAHGFRPGRSVMSFVAPHVGRTIVLKMDLRDFFVSITSARVMAIYLTAGYPEPVARLLTGPVHQHGAACGLEPGRTARARSGSVRPRAGRPGDCIASRTCPRALRLRRPWPTWPPTGSTRGWPAWPGRPMPATRAMPTTSFSRAASRSRDRSRRFPIHAAAIALEEGFAVQHRKTRVMRQGVRQRAAGVVINQKTKYQQG